MPSEQPQHEEATGSPCGRGRREQHQSPLQTTPTKTPPTSQPTRHTQVTSKATPIPFSTWTPYHAACHQYWYYHPRPVPRYPWPTLVPQAGSVNSASRILQPAPWANQPQASRTRDFATEFTLAIKTLPFELQRRINEDMDHIDWDELLASMDLSKYTGDRLAEVLGAFYHAKELWVNEKERQWKDGEKRRRGVASPPECGNYKEHQAAH